jgi:hypothetical protein
MILDDLTQAKKEIDIPSIHKQEYINYISAIADLVG